MRETIASLATLMFWKEPSMCILLREDRINSNQGRGQITHVSASTMRVRLAFSMVNFVLPS